MYILLHKWIKCEKVTMALWVWMLAVSLLVNAAGALETTVAPPGSSTADPCPFTTKQCQDGRCLHFFEDCPEDCVDLGTRKRCYSGGCSDLHCVGNCTLFHQCMNGECISLMDRCPEDPCPNNYKCVSTNKCYVSYERCDGRKDCRDGSDEKDCPVRSGWDGSRSQSLARLLTPMFALLLVASIGWRCYRLRILKQNRSRGPVIAGSEAPIPMTNHTSSNMHTMAPPPSNLPANAYPRQQPVGNGTYQQYDNSSFAPPAYSEAIDPSKYVAPPGAESIPQEAPPAYSSINMTSGGLEGNYSSGANYNTDYGVTTGTGNNDTPSGGGQV